MDILVIPQLDEQGGGGGSPTAAGYRLLHRTVEGGEVILTDRALTKIETDASELTLVVPPLVKGMLRDFFVRIVAKAEELPSLTFRAPAGESVSFEGDLPECSERITTIAFTEVDENVFIAHTRATKGLALVTFDPAGGECEEVSRIANVGAPIGELPVAERDRFDFAGWFTASEGGVKVTEETVVNGTCTYFAHWTPHDDPLREKICLTDNMSFTVDPDSPWAIDWSTTCGGHNTAYSAAMSGTGVSRLVGKFRGRGRLTLQKRVKSEVGSNYYRVIIDGEELWNGSGDIGFQMSTFMIETDGRHTLELVYDKVVPGSVENDHAWIAEINWYPEGGV